MNFNNQQINDLKSPDFAYWIGVAQTDGYFKRQFVKSRGVVRFFIVLGVGKKSLPMLNKFRDISQRMLCVKGSIYQSISYDKFLKYVYHFGCKNLLDTFRLLDIKFSEPLTPPSWVLESPELFGAYLAGVIDGDGDVRVTRPKYPRCYVRISSRVTPVNLINEMKRFLKCGVSNHLRVKQSKIAGRVFLSRCSITEFLVSKKNYEFIENNFVKHLALSYKKNKIVDYLRTKRAAVGI